jgi:acetylornithine deacetylase/succinyl-diaminopimelate desuccinylase-like protein
MPDAVLDSDRNFVFAEQPASAVIDNSTRSLLMMLLSNPSPTGSERILAEQIVKWATDRGIASHLDTGANDSASVVLTIPGTDRTAASTLIYAPLDTVCGGPMQQYVPWFGRRDARAQWSRTREIGGWLLGEGAENPKGYAAAALGAAFDIARSCQNRGDVYVALCGGSVPSLGDSESPTFGLGSGILRLLQRGMCPDAAIACKPGWYVAHEEAGVVWFRVMLAAQGSYVGFRHSAPYRNVIPIAGRLAASLERWLEDYSITEKSGTVAPQGAVSGIRAGIPELAAFVGEVCELRIDVRVGPHRTTAWVVRRVRRVIGDLLADEAIDWHMEAIASVPPSTTPQDSSIIEAARAAWAELENAPATVADSTSGVSDANLLRAWGIPTARVGMPIRPLPPSMVNDPFGMNAVNVADCDWLRHFLKSTVSHFGHLQEQS